MPHLSSDESPEYDLICIGFGPAALAIAVALHDLKIQAKVLFLEKQDRFAWHAGMLIPGARMQISFLKDLATFRDPKSHFTFLNFLKEKGRLEAFTNLDTFLPLRQEFNEYLTWAANQFENVHYETAATSIDALPSSNGRVSGWNVTALRHGVTRAYTTQKIICATGGNPQIPGFLQGISPNIIHSSHYLFGVPSLIPKHKNPAHLHLVVVGGGQSSAETFNDLTERYPEARITLYTAGFALKPSDDSPFVNEIFNPSLTSTLYSLPQQSLRSLTTDNRATNYSVVRPTLLEHLYSHQYQQRLTYGNDPTTWRHRIVGSHRLLSAAISTQNLLNLEFEEVLSRTTGSKATRRTVQDVDLLICGTGYTRHGHESLLQPVKALLANPSIEGLSNVTRNYQLQFAPGTLADGAGIWLQGVCEGTHGLSDSLLSILAVRAGEVVGDMFGVEDKKTSNGTNGHATVAGTFGNGVESANGTNGLIGSNRVHDVNGEH